MMLFKKRARRGNEEEFNEKVTTFINDGVSESTAINKLKIEKKPRFQIYRCLYSILSRLTFIHHRITRLPVSSRYSG